jgi:hypothetical protein
MSEISQLRECDGRTAQGRAVNRRTQGYTSGYPFLGVDSGQFVAKSPSIKSNGFRLETRIGLISPFKEIDQASVGKHKATSRGIIKTYGLALR